MPPGSPLGPTIRPPAAVHEGRLLPLRRPRRQRRTLRQPGGPRRALDAADGERPQAGLWPG